MKRIREHHKLDIRLFGFIALAVVSLGTFLSIGSLGRTIGDLRDAEISQSPTALLASSGLKDHKYISLPVTYYDQLADPCGDLTESSDAHFLTTREFEWTACNYTKKNLEQGLVEQQLGLSGVPVAIKGRLTPNMGLSFAGWFEELDGKSQEVPGTISLFYSAEDGTFTFEAEDFYPLDEVEFEGANLANTAKNSGASSKDLTELPSGEPASTASDINPTDANDLDIDSTESNTSDFVDDLRSEAPITTDDHNHLFTMTFTVPFTVTNSGTEMFTITADDDTFVFLDDQLAVDLGGVHSAMTGAFTIDKDGQVYTSVDGAEWSRTGQTLEPGTLAKVQVFHADRDSSESDFKIKFSDMNLAITGGAQIASADTVDPLSSAFTEPLGETKVFQPDTTRSLALIATIEGIAILAMSLMTVTVARYLLRQQQ